MFTALIIDDEEPVRCGIKLQGNWRKYGISTILEADNGQIALNILKQRHVDIILVDMKMPVMDGVNFLEIAKKEFPKIKYIVVSGYDDFEYTKQAIKSRVVSYLLKPIIKKELNKVLQTAVDELNQEILEEARKINENIAKNISQPLVKARIISLIIEGNKQTSMVEEYKKIIFPEKPGKIYGIALLAIINYDEMLNLKFKGDTFSMTYAVTNVIDEMCCEWNLGLSFASSSMKNEIVIFIESSGIDKAKIKSTAFKTIKRIPQKLKEMFRLHCCAAIGDFDTDIYMLNNCFQTARQVLDSINLLSNQKTVLISPQSETKERVSLMDKRELLVQGFETRSVEYCIKVMDDHFKDIETRGYFSIGDARKLLTEFLFIIEHIIAQFGLDRKTEEINNVINTLNNCMELDFERIKIMLKQVLEKVFLNIETNTEDSEKTYIYRIKEYMDKYYYKEIKIGMFADKYYFSKAYLSKLFKQEFGCGIYEYVLKIRMKKAEEMLKDTKLNIQDISDKLGYSDSNYFSKAFKKYYGISPSQLRNSIFNK